MTGVIVIWAPARAVPADLERRDRRRDRVERRERERDRADERVAGRIGDARERCRVGRVGLQEAPAARTQAPCSPRRARSGP